MCKVRLRGQTPSGQKVTFDLTSVIEKIGRLKGVEFNAIEFSVEEHDDPNFLKIARTNSKIFFANVWNVSSD